MSPAKRERERASGRARSGPPAAAGAAVAIGVLRCSVRLDIVSCAGVASKWAVPADPRLAGTPENLDIIYPRRDWLTIPNLRFEKLYKGLGVRKVIRGLRAAMTGVQAGAGPGAPARLSHVNALHGRPLVA